MVHYSYPFYDLSYQGSNLGMGMMLKAIEYAKNHNLKYIYLGRVYKKESGYKLQFKELSWFDKNIWNKDIAKLKGELE
jgi:arginyl-tRNA--protein-N-Asp/Glu arginylyltransferase